MSEVWEKSLEMQLEKALKEVVRLRVAAGETPGGSTDLCANCGGEMGAFRCPICGGISSLA